MSSPLVWSGPRCGWVPPPGGVITVHRGGFLHPLCSRGGDGTSLTPRWVCEAALTTRRGGAKYDPPPPAGGFMVFRPRVCLLPEGCTPSLTAPLGVGGSMVFRLWPHSSSGGGGTGFKPLVGDNAFPVGGVSTRRWLTPLSP